MVLLRAIFIRVKLPTMSYTDRLANLGLHSLEYRRVDFDLVMCFKIVKNLIDLDASAFFHTICHHTVQEGTQSNLVLCHYLTIIFAQTFSQSYTHLEFITRLCGYSILRKNIQV